MCANVCCAIYKFSDKLTTATTKRQQSPKGKQFNRAEKERKTERVERGVEGKRER